MIDIFCALYGEAQPLITGLSLKKIPENTCFQEFCDIEKRIRLVLTGVGGTVAATAAGYVFAKYPAKEQDVLLNIGVCAGKNPGAYLCHKLTEESTGRTCYPDILYQHPFAEAEIITTAQPVTKERFAADGALRDLAAGKAVKKTAQKQILYDMEAASIYQAASYFLAPHQMQFIKIVSDRGVEEKLLPEKIKECMEEQKEGLCDYIEKLLLWQEHENRRLQEEKLPAEIIEKFSAGLCCSKTMEETLKIYLRYGMLQKLDIRQILQDFYREGKLPCGNRREGKERFEELKARLLS